MAIFAKATEISLLEFGKEAYIQQLLASDPALLGLGDLVLRDKERMQPSAGRLDLLFESADGTTWYEVEVQLRGTDETHIIRTIEYWDLERRHRPNKRHIAVLVAETITSRFFNVISLFNQQIPVIAIQMQAYDVGGQKTIIFTSILDHSRQPEPEEEDTAYQPADSAYWRTRTSNEIMDVADDVLGFIREKNGTTSFKYNKGYIRTDIDGQPSKFITLRPQKKRLRLSLSCVRSIEMDSLIVEAGYELEYQDSTERYILWIYPGDFPADRVATQSIVQLAYKFYVGAAKENLN